MIERRHFIKKAAGSLAALGGRSLLQRLGLAAATGEESMILDALPGKQSLIKKTYRPPITKLRSIISTRRLLAITASLYTTITP